MRPFLVVGCGGSGGATLQFLADQLAADLSAAGLSMPKAWQFVHIDVPLAPDGAAPGMPPVIGSVAAGGRYVALGPHGAGYGTVASSVSEQLIANGAYSRMATWATHPNQVPASIAEGAGQMRSVGRVVTLSRLSSIKDQLTAALADINATGVRSDLAEIATQLGTNTAAQAMQGKPVALVVSSMAGGAGASMVLDVCRVLSQLPDVDTETTGLFLYTPEIFDSLPEHLRKGMPGNALAMLNELVATQLGAAAGDDEQLFSALGLGSFDRGRGRTFGRVFPIGARVGGEGARFGNGRLVDIYRGVGRGLAALMLSGEATRNWVSFDLGNDSPVEGNSDAFGWGAEPKDLQWGSFGFAQLSLGRARYAEYVAQRLAKVAVGQLLRGHRTDGDPATDADQLDRRVEDGCRPFINSLGLPEPGHGSAESWFNATFARATEEAGQRVVREHVDRVLSQPSGVAQAWVSYVEGAIRQQADQVRRGVEDEAYEIVHDAYERLLQSTEDAVAAVVSTDGLPTAQRLLARVHADLDHVIGQLREGAAQMQSDATVLHEKDRATARAFKGAVDAGHPLVQDLRSAYLESARMAVNGAVAARLVDLLVSYRADLLEPMRRAIREASASLQAAAEDPGQNIGLAQLRTEVVGEWPDAGERVPERFAHAQNEVLLTPAEDFPARYAEHVVSTMSSRQDPHLSVADATGRAVRQVVADQWETRATSRTGALLERRAQWRPAFLRTPPRRPDESLRTGQGVYRVAATPAEILSRARTWVAVPDSPFDEYVRTSLRTYVGAPELPDHVRAAREEEVASAFRRTLQLAQPLVAVDQALVQAVHGRTVTVTYKFSEVPFAGLALADRLRADLQQGAADPTSIETLATAMRPESFATRVDVFGSYTPLAPVSFSSLLRPLAAGWASATLPQARESFWAKRRARSLAGGVAMTQQQRRAVVGGWYVARFTGKLRYPGEADVPTGVEVYDDLAERDWLAFPNPLVVPEADLRAGGNDAYLPAVLLSYGLALARTSADGSLRPLRPYTTLRAYWDDSTRGTGQGRLDLLAADRHLKEWLLRREAPYGAPSRTTGPTAGDPEADRQVLLQQVEGIRALLGRDYLAPGEAGASGGGEYSVVSRREDLWGVPLFHEVACDAYVVLGQIAEMLRSADLTTEGSRTTVGLGG